MAEFHEFPVDEAKQRTVPHWQRRGGLYRLPHPCLRNDTLLMYRLAFGGPLGKLLKDEGNRSYIRSFIEDNSPLYDFMTMFRQKLLVDLGIIVFESAVDFPVDSMDEEERRAFEDYQRHHLDELISEMKAKASGR